jgi:transaldolase
MRFNASDVNIANRIHTPVDLKIVAELLEKFPDFERSYTENGIAVSDFDTFGPTVRTLRQFIEASHELDSQIRELMLPNPDKSL